MYEFDSQMMDATAELADCAKHEATTSLGYVDDAKYDLANRHILQAHKDVLASEQKIWSGLDRLKGLETRLMEMAV
jgi:hypothetical protein